MTQPPRIAITCDFLTSMGGAENVVLALAEAFPGAPIYTALYDQEKMTAFKDHDVRTSGLQRLPRWLRKSYKLLPTLAVRAMRRLDLSEYDIIIASTYLHGHQVTKARDDQVLIAYCHTPPRYYWSHYDEYRRDPGYGDKLNWLVRFAMPILIPRQRQLDLDAAAKVDTFIANSTATQDRIRQYYDRSSTVIHPPVDTRRFTPQRERGEHYVTIGRQLPYKRYDLAVQAASKLDLPLIVFGNGPMHDELKRLAGPTVQFRTDRFGDASDDEYEKGITTAKGFIYGAEEDFGIVTVEALAAGAPVIAYGKAGTLDIITSDELGELFEEQSVDSMVAAIKRTESRRYFPSKLARTAKRFDKGLFISKIQKIIFDVSR